MYDVYLSAGAQERHQSLGTWSYRWLLILLHVPLLRSSSPLGVCTISVSAKGPKSSKRCLFSGCTRSRLTMVSDKLHVCSLGLSLSLSLSVCECVHVSVWVHTHLFIRVRCHLSSLTALYLIFGDSISLSTWSSLKQLGFLAREPQEPTCQPPPH